jgi:hypothetical protein
MRNFSGPTVIVREALEQTLKAASLLAAGASSADLGRGKSLRTEYFCQSHLFPAHCKTPRQGF